MLQHSPRQCPLQLQPLSQDDPAQPSMTWDTTPQAVSIHLQLYCQGGPSLACPRTPLAYSHSRPCLPAKATRNHHVHLVDLEYTRWTWSTSLCMDTSGIHLQTQKCVLRRTPADSRYEYLTSGKEYIDPRKTW